MLKRLLILALAVWLPLSVSAAGAMSLAMFGKAGAASDQMAEGCEMHQSQPALEASSSDCHNCSLCHFACTALMSAYFNADAVLPAWIAANFAVPNVRLYVPDRLQRPPLVLAA